MRIFRHIAPLAYHYIDGAKALPLPFGPRDWGPEQILSALAHTATGAPQDSVTYMI